MLTIGVVPRRHPIMTPVRVPPNESGAMPACSSASQATSRSIRCCGSIASASRGEIPKKSASNPATSETNPPHFGRHPARRQRVRIIELLGIPTIRRHLADRILTVDQQPPKTLRPNHITGETAPDSHHRHRFSHNLFGNFQTRAEFIDLAQRLGDHRAAVRRCASHLVHPSLSESCCSNSASVRSS